MRILQTLVIFILVFTFSGCIKKFDEDGLTLKIEESELNSSFRDFPMERNFVFANVNINQPNLKITNDRLNALVDVDFSAIFIPKDKGIFELSGVPYFDKEKSAIFLRDVKIENIKFANIALDKNFTNLFVSNMNPVFNNIFTTMPIYKIDKTSFLTPRLCL
jgi:hypothetical protein